MKLYPDDYVDSDGNLIEKLGHFIHSGLVHELPTAAVEHHLQRRAAKAGEAMAVGVKEEDEDDNKGDDDEGERMAEDVKEEVEPNPKKFRRGA